MLESPDKIWEEFCHSLEEIIDSADDMWFEEQHCNYREQIRIKNERYNPARDKLRETLDKYLETKLNEMWHKKATIE